MSDFYDEGNEFGASKGVPILFIIFFHGGVVMAKNLMADEVKDNRIEKRAYELFLQEGCQHGKDFEHWLRAEKEILEGNGGGEEMKQKVKGEK